MAKSRFEYVRNFELPDTLIPNTYIVVRIDGRGFHKFSDAHKFAKPNDVPALDLMNRAARAVMDDLPDVVMAFGESDEFSFLIRRSSNLYNRRRSKVNSTVCSLFTSAYVFYWSQHLPDRPLLSPPTFDSRVVLYPSEREVRDYFSWRQADTHINNLYNTCFWALVQSGISTTETNRILQGTDSKVKNEMLFSQFSINYNNLSPMFRKGSTLVRTEPAQPEGSTTTAPGVADDQVQEALTGTGSQGGQTYPNGVPSCAVLESEGEGEGVGAAVSGQAPPPSIPQGARRGKRPKKVRPYEGLTGDVVVLHEDIIGDRFWAARGWLLA